MRSDAYEQTARLEDHHWWFAGRRAVLGSLLGRLAWRNDATILEAGCGSGGNLALLSQFGETSAFEPDPGAMGFARLRGIGRVVSGSLPDSVPFAGERFDLVAALDVLEHVADDWRAVGALLGYVAPGGYLILTVPALPALWGPHDFLHRHHRRYTTITLRRLLLAHGLVVERLTYFNSFLFPLAALARLVARATGRTTGSSLGPVPALINGILKGILAAERHIVPYANLPIGLSILAITRVHHK